MRGPESGEFAGPAESIGVRGFGLRFPEVRIELPELRLPSLVKYRRNPEMIVSESRAPFVRGEALEFNQVTPESGPAPTEPESRPVNICVPPAPAVGARERRLAEELALKEAEIQDMNRRFAQLESMVSQLVEQKVAIPQSAPAIVPSSYEQPAPLPQVALAPMPRRDPVAAPAPVQIRPAYQPPPSRPLTSRRSSTSAAAEFGAWSEVDPEPLKKAEVLGYELADPFK